MTALVIAMLLCVAAGAVVVGFVTVEARREGREMLTAEGEQLLSTVRQRSDAAIERGGQLGKRAVETVGRR